MTGSTLTFASSAAKSVRWKAIAALLLAAAVPLPGFGAVGASTETPLIGVIVRATADGAAAAADAIAEVGGVIGRSLPIINGFAARVPATAIERLGASSGVSAVSPDGQIRPLTDDSDAAGTGTVDTGSLNAITKIVGADKLWRNGYTGAGVDVALIDTGIAPVNGLRGDDKIVNGPDLSFDSQSGVLYLDQYGHGTHMAGIIAGLQDGVTPSGYTNPDNFVGVAPGSRLVNVKVGAFDGATDVSQVIAAIDWVVQHRNDLGMNIRVLNLSFGTDSTQSYLLDPLAYAAEVAWRKGIFVVAASGNDGSAMTSLAMPAADPFLFAVGASDPNGTYDLDDDTIPEWAQRGTAERHVDVVAPGTHVASLDVPGSYVNTYEETVHVGGYLRGSGTSQAAAVASGVAALLYQKYPNATPDQMKAVLQATAKPMGDDDSSQHDANGYGVINAQRAARYDTLPATPAQPYTYGTGTGSLEASRGTIHVEHNGVELVGEVDIFGNAWDGQRWSADAWAGTSWYGGLWNGQRWSGDGWEGQRWSGQRWSGQRWSGQRWSDVMWDGQRWSGQRWSDMTWDGQRWSGTGWDGQRWSGQRWSGQRWSGQRWSAQRWSGSRWSAAYWG